MPCPPELSLLVWAVFWTVPLNLKIMLVNISVFCEHRDISLVAVVVPFCLLLPCVDIPTLEAGHVHELFVQQFLHLSSSWLPLETSNVTMPVPMSYSEYSMAALARVASN